MSFRVKELRLLFFPKTLQNVGVRVQELGHFRITAGETAPGDFDGLRQHTFRARLVALLSIVLAEPVQRLRDSGWEPDSFAPRC